MIMSANILNELASDIKKLHTLEESIIYGERIESRDLRSKQALLVSDVIQSLQRLENTIKRGASFPVTNQISSLTESRVA